MFKVNSRNTRKRCEICLKFKVSNKNTGTTSLTSFRCFYCWLWTYFTVFSSISIVDFKQVNVSGKLIIRDLELFIHINNDLHYGHFALACLPLWSNISSKLTFKTQQRPWTLFHHNLNQLMTIVPHDIETSQLVWSANQLTGFYMMWNTAR